MSPLKDRIQEDMKVSMRAKNAEKLGTIRLILAALKQWEIDCGRLSGKNLDDPQVIVILDKLAKQRRESITQFTAGERPDLVEKEESELDIILSYLPKALSDEEIKQLIEKAMQETGANSIKDMGKVMAMLKPQLQGRADMSKVSQQIKTLLS